MSCALYSAHPAHAQEPQKWKSFQQTFMVANNYQHRQEYTHQVTLGNGKFVTNFVRQFGPIETYTGVVTTNLAEIDTAKMKIVKGKEGYLPEYWYLYVPVKNPNNAPERVRATPKTDRSHLIVKDQVWTYNSMRSEETWILTKMYLNFDNEAAARQAMADITAACR